MTAELTGMGSFQAAPTMDGLTMARGRFDPSCISRCSANCLVNVQVFGLVPINRGVMVLIMSSSIHLQKHAMVHCTPLFYQHISKKLFYSLRVRRLVNTGLNFSKYQRQNLQKYLQVLKVSVTEILYCKFDKIDRPIFNTQAFEVKDLTNSSKF